MGFSAKPEDLIYTDTVKRLVWRPLYYICMAYKCMLSMLVLYYHPTVYTHLSRYLHPISRYACRDNIQVIRRFTGGGTVIVDNQTVFVSFIMNVSNTNISIVISVSLFSLTIIQYKIHTIYHALHTPYIILECRRAYAAIP
ncbi:hypothetical protein EON63_00905 [archaeon]|nr:MAG: hypothetical protein EON63_00905 [archaeon]